MWLADGSLHRSRENEIEEGEREIRKTKLGFSNLSINDDMYLAYISLVLSLPQTDISHPHRWGILHSGLYQLILELSSCSFRLPTSCLWGIVKEVTSGTTGDLSAWCP